MNKIVKSFLTAALIFDIFFLTSCAVRRYHDPVRSGVVQGFEQGPFTSLSFVWPVQGRVISPYGTKEDGVTLKGVVLEGFEGQQVRSAEHGRVVFVDAGMRGYGKTIIVEHGSGYSTVYARNSRILVRVGDSVQKNQCIAQVGLEGKGKASQIYFELRQNSRPLDPQQTLK